MMTTSFLHSAISAEDVHSFCIFCVTLVMCRLLQHHVTRNWGHGTPRGVTLPKGPRGWPLVGYAPYLGKYPHKVMAELGRYYGDVYSLSIGPRTVVVVNGVDAVKEVLVRHGRETSGRTPPARATAVNTAQGYFWSSGELWRVQRKFGRGVLRQIGGTGQHRLDREIRSEATVLCAEIARRANYCARCDIGSLVDSAVANIMCTVVFGCRFEYGDADFKRMMELSFEIQSGGFSAIENFLPSLYKLPFLFRQAKAKKRAMRSFVRDKLYWGREAQIDPGRAGCLADLYLMEMERQMCLQDHTGIQFTEDHLVSAGWDMFIAGVETTAVTLQWAMLYLALYTDVQKKIQAEIDRVVGQNGQPSWSNQADMPYTRATIMEIQRCANIVPIALPHTVTEDFILRGYTIPKGTVLFINLWSVMMDPNQWVQPEVFRPERFLNDDLQIVKPEAFMPFSAGPRVCMGEKLARMELFIIITSILQRFDLTLPRDKPRPCLDPLPGITCGPQPYQVCVSTRQKTGKGSNKVKGRDKTPRIGGVPPAVDLA